MSKKTEPSEKLCAGPCNSFKKLECFGSNERMKDGCHYYCNECVKSLKSYQQYYQKQYQRSPEIRTPVSEKMKEELFNIANNLGIDKPSFFRMAFRKIIESYPENMRDKKNHSC